MIEKIKELRKRSVIESHDIASLLNYLDCIADYLIEQHEQKEKEWKVIWDYKLKEVVRDKDLNVIKVDPVVKVGQIWRGPDEYIEIVNYEMDKEYVLSNEFELVTMDNIREGEWFEYKGDKYKLYAKIGDCNYVSEHASYGDVACTPCLPPKAKEEKKDVFIRSENGTTMAIKMDEFTKLYTQAYLDKTAIQEFNKGKAVGYEEGYKSAEDNFKKMLEVHGYLK